MTVKVFPRFAEYQHWFVNDFKSFDDARQYCLETYQGDLIQYDPRVYTLEGRQLVKV